MEVLSADGSALFEDLILWLKSVFNCLWESFFNCEINFMCQANHAVFEEQYEVANQTRRLAPSEKEQSFTTSFLRLRNGT